jgi:hypothetical protein
MFTNVARINHLFFKKHHFPKTNHLVRSFCKLNNEPNNEAKKEIIIEPINEKQMVFYLRKMNFTMDVLNNRLNKNKIDASLNHLQSIELNTTLYLRQFDRLEQTLETFLTHNENNKNNNNQENPINVDKIANILESNHRKLERIETILESTNSLLKRQEEMLYEQTNLFYKQKYELEQLNESITVLVVTTMISTFITFSVTIVHIVK